MALNWSWKDKMGTAKVEGYEGGERKALDANIYDCNGLFVMTFEWEADGEEKYSMADFAVDEAHFKNCLGLGDDKTARKHGWYEVNLNMAYKKAVKMATILMKAQAKGLWNGTLNTYYREV